MRSHILPETPCLPHHYATFRPMNKISITNTANQFFICFRPSTNINRVIATPYRLHTPKPTRFCAFFIQPRNFVTDMYSQDTTEEERITDRLARLGLKLNETLFHVWNM